MRLIQGKYCSRSLGVSRRKKTSSREPLAFYNWLPAAKTRIATLMQDERSTLFAYDIFGIRTDVRAVVRINRQREHFN
jgi:hypothetical protein